MGEYKNENWVKNGKKWANIRMKNGTKFFDGKKVGKYKNFLNQTFFSPIMPVPGLSILHYFSEHHFHSHHFQKSVSNGVLSRIVGYRL